MFVREIVLTIQKLNIVEEIFDKASLLTLFVTPQSAGHSGTGGGFLLRGHYIDV